MSKIVSHWNDEIEIPTSYQGKEEKKHNNLRNPENVSLYSSIMWAALLPHSCCRSFNVSTSINHSNNVKDRRNIRSFRLLISWQLLDSCITFSVIFHDMDLAYDT